MLSGDGENELGEAIPFEEGQQINGADQVNHCKMMFVRFRVK